MNPNHPCRDTVACMDSKADACTRCGAAPGEPCREHRGLERGAMNRLAADRLDHDEAEVRK